MRKYARNMTMGELSAVPGLKSVDDMTIKELWRERGMEPWPFCEMSDAQREENGLFRKNDVESLRIEVALDRVRENARKHSRLLNKLLKENIGKNIDEIPYTLREWHDFDDSKTCVF